MSETMAITTPDGAFNAYRARPTKRSGAAIVVLQEILGINADMRQTCAEMAAQGYVAICPDLFWRMEPGVDLSDQTEAEWKKGLALYNAFNLDTGVADIDATMAAARALPGSSGKVGLLGYCLGRRLLCAGSTWISIVTTRGSAVHQPHLPGQLPTAMPEPVRPTRGPSGSRFRDPLPLPAERTSS
jgi:dienelactone hydrolase